MAILSTNILSKYHFAVAVGLIMALTSAHAATYIVNTIDDVDADDEFCTLREAIASVNDPFTAPAECFASGNIGVDDTIEFDPSLNAKTIGLVQSAALRISRDVVINGPGSDLLTVDGSGNGPSVGIFHVEIVEPGDLTVELNGLTISGSTSSSGGGVLAIGPTVTVSLTGSTVSDNMATVQGGGIFASDSTINLINSTVFRNTAGTNGGGIFININGNLNLSGATVSDNTADGGHGGGIYSGGSSISLNDSHVSNNTSDGGAGGGVFAGSDSTINLSNHSTVSGNTALDQGGGIYVSGNGVSFMGLNAILTDSTVAENVAKRGGGVYINNFGGASLSNSAVSSNSAEDTNGGGIYVNATSSVSLENSVVSSNAAMRSGGGIYVNNGSAVSLANSTVSANSAVGEGVESGDGGGIFVDNTSTVDLVNSTVSGNSAADDGGGISVDHDSTITLINSTLSGNTTTNLGGGFFINGASILELTNSIVSGNSYTNPSGGAAEIRVDFGGGTVTADMTNVLGDSSHNNDEAFDIFIPELLGTDIIATSDGNQPSSLSSILKPLANNDGPTETHALTEGSVAIDAGDDAICASAPVSGLDQRGITRPRGPHCDIGSYEWIDDSICPAVKTSTGATVVFCL